MNFNLLFSEQAKNTLKRLEADQSKMSLLKQLRKVLAYMEINLRHPSLNTHKFSGVPCSLGEVFETGPVHFSRESF